MNHLETQIAVLQEQVTQIRKDVASIKDNHLESIYRRLRSIETRSSYYAGGLAVLIIILDVILKFVV